ncbi:TlpA disulfide reductase family protein [Acidisoma sp.]|uniref:TlpA disulfide reductase family protein n=1 Tax=Acidisoma sp. TaxID=1872115 RepID=UPI003B0017CD
MSLKVSRRRVLVTAATVAAGTIGGNLAPRRALAQEMGSVDDLEEMPPGATLPAFQFFTADNQPRTLADYRGRGVVLNLWATWCGPCVAEMPTLDTLAAAVSADDIVVLPVSSDAGGAASVRAFYDGHDIDHLPVLLDPGGAVTQAWQVPGIPVTVIFDRSGHPRARLIGGADWSTPAAVAKVKALCGPNLSKIPAVKI